MLYLDHAATTAVRPEVREAMAPFFDEAYGNPSGIHAVSRRAKNAIEEARERAAELLGAAHPREIIFTGGGTEADNLAILGVALAGGSRRPIVTTAVEHEAVLEAAAFAGRLGCEVTVAEVDGQGRVDPAEIASLCPPNAVVSVMLANNETGAIQPVAAVAAAVVEATDGRCVIHTDAVQAFISEPVTARGTQADLIALAAHKVGGPKGSGLLFARGDIELEPVIHGGGQEMGRRSGTHNVAGIVGMVTALEIAAHRRDEFRTRVGAARDGFEEVLAAELGNIDITVDEPRLVQHSHLRVPGVSAETLLIRLDQAGVAAAAGSACQSGAVEISHVLAAMGISPTAAGEYLRFTFGWPNSATDGFDAAKRVAAVVRELR